MLRSLLLLLYTHINLLTHNITPICTSKGLPPITKGFLHTLSISPKYLSSSFWLLHARKLSSIKLRDTDNNARILEHSFLSLAPYCILVTFFWCCFRIFVWCGRYFCHIKRGGLHSDRHPPLLTNLSILDYCRTSCQAFLFPKITLISENVHPRVLPFERLRASLPQAATVRETECIVRRHPADHRSPAKLDLRASQAGLKVLPRPGSLPASRQQLRRQGGNSKMLSHRSR